MMNKHRGFTLIELLIVMAILALLAGLVGPTLWNKLSGAKRDVTATQIKNIESSLDSYRLDMGKFPKELNELLKDSTGKSAWDGPYMKKIPKDPWESDYQYVSPGKHNKDYDLYSMGADGQEGGEDDNQDITNWE
ncbi:MAG: type II secretion system major pseudopilin GspG [gamma proteobacterium symbiont of Bathyaustriella thionipta]|nr:type II secretion system major pseudopilin GspG [gamma proteobacterium symbiont of Bathyaustriella thionipta]MCU7951311.1 type II secretion system major pseudopilin GspG [gamma proteobacterium symbiont of Bathyaustriella thionipta]MCU7952186.1 type II secretion system major pseudopilin GspG [gamma proteobacterium symbiont of Bathyaustriella thionipta]MCU7957866.1 type II secretion system major pseudopilin GspG [gamma proteobacterium symbiont of Bathyaustriella thionipta]MCU7968593.1 type II 